ncbi:hypothetical protein CVT26_015524 [Gymnopilus dilepis]|uniref:Uncharacterized protein n=1 Tax=Gymnopilus dilepis TaxID=231916 RepID=A0A409YD45_9AGAR|nr:hypothetical protein CVT26_015524 [Gymnopilus dilepis]
MTEDNRPAKRPRRGMHVADGFQVLETTAKPAPVAVPKFISAFDRDAESSKDSSRKVIMRRKQGVSAPRTEAGPSIQDTVSSVIVETREVVRELGGEGRLKGKEREKEKDQPKAISVFQIADGITLADPKNRKGALKMRPARPPPVIASSSSSTSAGRSSVLKQVAPPVLKPPSKTNTKPLHPVQQPVIPANATSRKGKEKEKDLRSLSTTGFALGLLQSTQNGNAEELAGILLRDQHPEIMLSSREGEEETGESAAKRGLEMSPEKKGRGASAKYVRGGLAADASAFFDLSQTAFILWKKEIERRPNAFPPEFGLAIIKILHMPLPARSHFRNSSFLNSTSPGIALCRVQPPSSPSYPSIKPDRLHRTVVLFPNSVDSNDAMSAAQFVEGRVVLVFKPLQEIHFQSAEETEQDMFDSLPASLPLPLSGPHLTPDPLDAPTSDTGLVITRFYIKSP